MAGFLCNNWNPDKISPKKPNLGVPIGPYLEKSSSEMLAHFESTTLKLEKGGYTIHRVNTFNNFEDIYENHNLVVAKEAAQTHKDWYKKFGNLYHPKTAELIEQGQNISEIDYARALSSQKKVQDELNGLMGKNNIDLWLSPPALGPAPLGLDSTGDPVMNLPWTHCGFPAINIPAGVNEDRLPIGLQVSASKHSDESLLSWAIDIESIISLS
jgi:Asp-tRNA(Asn)/Glu-tRNA(Gln) amidotransferase A subunit family amidase